jgi:hypothetical protein
VEIFEGNPFSNYLLVCPMCPAAEALMTVMIEALWFDMHPHGENASECIE